MGKKDMEKQSWEYERSIRKMTGKLFEAISWKECLGVIGEFRRIRHEMLQATPKVARRINVREAVRSFLTDVEYCKRSFFKGKDRRK